VSTQYPVSLRVWEPHLNAVSYLRTEGGEIVGVTLERDEKDLPLQWRRVGSDETFPCSDYRLWAPRISDLL
jgi:hypothetical protein